MLQLVQPKSGLVFGKMVAFEQSARSCCLSLGVDFPGQQPTRVQTLDVMKSKAGRAVCHQTSASQPASLTDLLGQTATKPKSLATRQTKCLPVPIIGGQSRVVSDWDSHIGEMRCVSSNELTRILVFCHPAALSNTTTSCCWNQLE